MPCPSLAPHLHSPIPQFKLLPRLTSVCGTTLTPISIPPGHKVTQTVNHQSVAVKDSITANSLFTSHRNHHDPPTTPLQSHSRLFNRQLSISIGLNRFQTKATRCDRYLKYVSPRVASFLDDLSLTRGARPVPYSYWPISSPFLLHLILWSTSYVPSYPFPTVVTSPSPCNTAFPFLPGLSEILC